MLKINKCSSNSSGNCRDFDTGHSINSRGILTGHILVFIVGCGILVSGIFQSSLWFDESYTVGLMNHSFIDMIKWSADDVHPHLYYIMLKIFTLIFGGSITVMRLFSVIGAALFALLGLTHIRRDFGEQIGFWFTFTAIFLPALLVYALQIRMYTWAMYFVALTTIYAFRRTAGQDSFKNRILFVVFSTAAAYTHYFALFTVAAINIMLLVYDKKRKKPLKTWFLLGAVQIAAYIPGAVIFLKQIERGGAGWIQIVWERLILELVSYHFIGSELSTLFTEGDKGPYFITGAILLSVYALFCIMIRRRILSDQSVGGVVSKSALAVRQSAILYFSVILFSLLVSVFRPIYYIRYTMVIFPMLVFAMAYFISGYKHVWQKLLSALILIAIFAYQGSTILSVVYDESSDKPLEYIDERIGEEDIFIFDHISGYPITVNYPDHNVYFYGTDNWGIDNRASGPKSYVLDVLECSEIDEYKGYIWVIGRGKCFEYLNNLSSCREVSSESFYVRYYKQYFEIILMEKS